MLHKLLLSALLLCVYLPAQAQTCSDSPVLVKGTSWEMTQFGKKGKKESVTRYAVIARDKIPDGVKWTMNAVFIDKKGKEIHNMDHTLECVKGALRFDMRSVLDPNVFQIQNGMDVQINTQQLEYPSRLKAGMTLPDGSINIKTSMGQMTLLNMTVHIKDRKVEAEENLTVAAGTYKAFRISQTTLVDTRLIKRESKSVDYFVPGFTVIKSETLNKKGKVESYTELTAFKQG